MSSSETFQAFAERMLPRVDAALDYAAAFPDAPPLLREAMRYSLLSPGKRLRPLLTLAAAELCGGSADLAMPAACAVEMVHAYSLIHDDLPAMDDDDTRRGQPTCHRVYGEAQAILAGDGLLTASFALLAAEVQPPDLAVRCIAILSQAAGPAGMVGGQSDDVRGEKFPSIDDVRSMHERKTGALIEASLELGALIAGASAQHRKALRDYGSRLGLLFQITDDLLDASAHEVNSFPALLGVDGSNAEAKRLYDDACTALEVFGERALVLRSLAESMLHRDR